MSRNNCRAGFSLRRALARLAALCLLAISYGQSPPSKTSDTVFKNVQVLKGISVDEFIGTMGIMCTALGMDCADCHDNAGTVKVDWAADTPKKIRARRMVQMVNAINRDNFSGRQMVTCWSCHHGRDRPSTTPSMENVYGPGPQEMDDVLTQVKDGPTPDKIIDRYLQAVGGAERWAAIKSFSAQGKSFGFGGFGGQGRVQLYAKFPDHRATIIDFPGNTERGDSTRTYNGREGWVRTPLTILGEYELTGSDLDGARLDAQLAFPGQIKETLKNLRASIPATISDLPGPSAQASMEAVGQDRLVDVVQGTTPGGTLATLYFDQKSGLLVRMVRYGKSPIGRIPTQIDFADYREVNGVKIPFRMLFAWLDGRDAIQLSEVTANVAIDESKFGRPK